jgi:hypothetical protein
VPNAPSAGFEKGERGALTVKELRRGDWVKIGGGLWLWGIGDVVPRARTGFSLRGWGGSLVSGCGHRGGVATVVLEETGKGKGRWMGER